MIKDNSNNRKPNIPKISQKRKNNLIHQCYKFFFLFLKGI
jgi:hypothetical protein